MKQNLSYNYSAKVLFTDHITHITNTNEVRKFKHNFPGTAKTLNPINCNLYAYAAHNPVHYIDPTGLDIDDWQKNDDGTWTVISKGAKLWDVWGENWDILSGVTSEEDAKKIQIGQKYGFNNSQKNNTSSILEDYSKELLSRENNISIPTSTHEYFCQGLLGFGEMGLGILGYIGVTAYGAGEEAAALKCNGQIDPSVGYSMMTGYSACSVLFADGFNLFTGAFQKNQKDSIFWKVFQNLITDPMVDVGKGLSNALNEQRERNK